VLGGNAKSFRAQGNARSDISLDAGSESQDIRKFLARRHALSNSRADFFEAIDDARMGMHFPLRFTGVAGTTLIVLVENCNGRVCITFTTAGTSRGDSFHVPVHTENSIQRFPVKCHIVTSRSPS
jgi:hypothetical protein